MNNSELLKGLSIEELQERDEFIAASGPAGPAGPDGFSHCIICEC